MALEVDFEGTLTLSDTDTGTLTGKKIIAAIFDGTISTIAESRIIPASPTSIGLPVTATQVVYIKNLHATNTVTVTWTRNGGGSVSVVVLEPLSMILLVEANTTSGITALSLTASANTPVDYVLAG